MKSITLSQAIFGFTLATKARHLSQHTLDDYLNTLHKLQAFIKTDPLIGMITRTQLREFMASHTNLSNKTLLNYHTGLSAFYTWLVNDKIVPDHLMHTIERPKPEIRTLTTIPVEHIRAMFSAIERTRAYERPGKRTCSNQIPTAQRNRLILLLLLDTGMRASELCNLHIYDVDMDHHTLRVFGKGNKERKLIISPRTSKEIWRYLAEHRTENQLDAPLIATQNNRPMDRNNLRHIIARICSRAHVPNYTPHDFRHTFATEYLRNHPNIYALQETLGHTTLDMVKKYLAISQSDLEAAHRLASPVEKWGL